jgi:hypothetical protein
MFNLRGPTGAEPEDHLWSADHSLRSAALYYCIGPKDYWVGVYVTRNNRAANVPI